MPLEPSVADGYIEGNGGLRNYSGGQNDIRGEVYLGGTVGDTLYIPAAGGAATINGDLTVQGDVSLTGANVLTADTVSATTYVGLPFPDLTPITLDVGNNRVGINNNAPSHALTVQGSVAVKGNDVGSDTVNTEVLYATIGVVPQGVDARYQYHIRGKWECFYCRNDDDQLTWTSTMTETLMAALV
jgi:hypothetical protein